MKSFAQTIDLLKNPKLIEKYEEYHRNVWPEVMNGLKVIGIERMEIFRIGNHLFMYCSANDDFDPNADFQKYTETHPKADEWNDLMSNFQAKVPEAEIGDWWAPMKLVFDSEWFE
tara:strand:- start:25 stop:369 length:345 start_codon:yes stop_codon:yes gene_type:complete